MNLLKKLKTFIGGKEKEKPVVTYADFWNWFSKRAQTFHNVVKAGQDFESGFFSLLMPKLNELRDGYFFLCGMMNETTAELIFTAEGRVENIVFVEDLVAAAPAIPGWKFTASKPASSIENTAIKMNDVTYSRDNLFFYANERPHVPDQINITIILTDFTGELKNEIKTGVYIFLENYLGELNTVSLLDVVNVSGKDDSGQELIPIEKLKSYLEWRQKEFVEKYEGMRRSDAGDDMYATFSGEFDNKPFVMVINRTILDWDGKASHPWMLEVHLKYNGTQNRGLPSHEITAQMEIIEDDLTAQLPDLEGFLYVGRETGDNVRKLFLACKDFRKSSRMCDVMKKKYKDKMEIDWFMYKDKYWQSFDKFKQ